MSIRRRLVSAVCVLSLGSSAVSGQQAGNPFAEWDKLQKTAEPQKTAEATPRPVSGAASASSKVEYFSPRPAADSGSPGTIRERMKPVAAEALTSAEAKEPTRIATEAESAEKAETDKPVQRAEFISDEETASGERIVPVSGLEQPTKDRSDSENPFAEMLQSADPGRPAATPMTRHSNSETRLPVSTDDAGPQSPGVTVEWVRQGEFNVGQPCTLELVVQNTSRSLVRGVVTEAVVPAELQVVSVTPQPVSSTPVPSWNIGDLKAGEKRTISMQVVPRLRGNIQLSAAVKLTGYTSASFAVQEPLIAVEVSGPEAAEVGQQVNYVVRASNPGTGVASNVLIQAAIPEGLEHRRGSLLTIEIGTLNPGESRQAQLNLTALKGGAHQMAVRVVADGNLSDQTVAAVAIAEPRLTVQISGSQQLMAGRTETFAVQVSNDGTVPSANVRARYRVPEGFEFIRADRGGKYNPVDRSIEWFVGTVSPGDSSHFSVSLRADSTGKLLHQAGVMSEHGRVTMAEHATLVEGMAALELRIVASSNGSRTLKINDELTYQVHVSNNGNRPAATVGMSCELPAGLELVEAAGPSDFIAENGVLIFKSLPQIEAGKSAVFSITVRSTREGSHRLRLRVASESISEPLIGEETTTVSVR